MPLFAKKLTKEQKKALDIKLQIAEDKPDSYFDLSDCSISKIPEGIFPKIKVLQKQALLLQHNLLEDFKGGGVLSDLSQLIILDISHNKFTQLPKALGELKSLQKLNIAHNKVKKLPEEIGMLTQLQVLDASDNQLCGLPSTMKNLKEMQSLDITTNIYLTQLSTTLCYMPHLKDFKFDQEKITYPAKEITSLGIEEIQRWFKKLVGDDFMMDQTDATSRSTTSSLYPKLHKMPTEDAEFEDAIIKREMERDQQNRERIRLEQELQETQEDNAKFLAHAQHQRDQVIKEIEKADMEAEAAMVKKFESESTERNKLLEDLYLKNDHLDETVNFVLQMSERTRQTEMLMEELEEEQARMDHLVEITVEESERLRKQEIIDAMNLVMMENEYSRRQWNKYEEERDRQNKKSIVTAEEDTEGLKRVLEETDVAQQELMQKILTEEERQKKAFQALQFQKDVKLNRLNKQLELVEAELAQISLLEIQKRAEKQEQEVNMLAEMRIQTAVLLSQLIEEQEKREERLKEMVIRMEEQRDDEAKDYWLIQFQRLLDSKPQVLVDAENRLDVFVAETLLQAGCKEYLPHFARHNVDEDEILVMTKERLREIGVKDEASQDDIMAAIKSQKLMNDNLMKRQESYGGPGKGAVADTEDAGPSVPPVINRPSMDVCQEIECVVCLDNKPDIVFLPCGHVCTCSACCGALKDCPMCRQEITQRFRLYGT